MLLLIIIIYNKVCSVILLKNQYYMIYTRLLSIYMYITENCTVDAYSIKNIK